MQFHLIGDHATEIFFSPLEKREEIVYLLHIGEPDVIGTSVFFSPEIEVKKGFNIEDYRCIPHKSLNRLWRLLGPIWDLSEYQGIGGDGLYYFTANEGSFEYSFTCDTSKYGEKYNPLEDKRLWQNFLAPIDYRLKAHSLFLKYGFLFGDDEGEMYDIHDLMHDSQPLCNFAEPVEAWYIEFDALRFAKDIWSIISNEDHDEDKKLFLLKNRVNKFIKEERGDSLDLLLNLESTVETKYFPLLSSFISNKIGSVGVAVSLDNSLNMTTTLVPRNLASAVWIQFSEFVSEGGKLLNCNHCQQPFVRLRGQHRDRAFCSNACKQASWRNRPEQKARRQKRDQP